MKFDVPPEVKIAQDKVDEKKDNLIERLKANQASEQYVRNTIRSAETELAEAMLTPVQKEMSDNRSDWSSLLEGDLEKAGLSLEDADRIVLRLEKVGSQLSNERDLTGVILGKKDETDPSKKTKDRTIRINLSWDSEKYSVLKVGEAFVDGDSISSDLAQKIAEKYAKVADTLEFLSKEDEKLRLGLQKEKREFEVAKDLL